MSGWASKQRKKAEFAEGRTLDGLDGHRKEVDATKGAANGKGEESLFDKKLTKEEIKAEKELKKAELKLKRDAKKAEKEAGAEAAADEEGDDDEENETVVDEKTAAKDAVKADKAEKKAEKADKAEKTATKKKASDDKKKGSKGGSSSKKQTLDELIGVTSDGKETESDRLAREEHIIATYAQGKAQHANARDIQVSDVTISFHGANLIENTDFALNYGNRYGFIGPNGSGKSTIMKAIAAKCLPIPESIDLYFLAEEYPATDIPALQAVFEVDDVRKELEAEAERVNELIGVTDDEEMQAALSQRLESLYERLDELDGSTAEMRASIILHGLGFTPKMQKMTTKEFSGGWRMRVALARALFLQPTCLVLDEPTNHLDMEAVFWLEDYLASWKKMLFFVSHSQDFMNGVCTHVIRLNEHTKKLDYYAGNYDSYVAERKVREDDQQRKYDSEQREIAEIKDFIARFGHGTIKMVRQAQSREKLLAKKLEAGLTEKPQLDAQWDFTFPDPGALPTPVLMIQSVSFAYPGCEPLYTGLDCGIDLDSRIALVGPNGAGKTTFVKLMTGELQPTAGAVRPHSHLRMAKFTQHFEDVLDLDMNALDWIQAKYPKEFDKIEKARSWLGRYGCTSRQQSMPMSQLSDGQKARIVFAKLAMDKPHLLMLDEPTNHLDMESIDSLAKMINKFQGGLVLVSHDMRLISQVAREIWICDKKCVTRYEGDILKFKLAAKKEQKKKLDQHMHG
ncbi:P-loop containing nucleoside triphosphate hydrolase protein [Pelagophyceae sp. CCMP2097]|nr:P-loop containing nucleoside triphosphate hydrolase protein [Pelagophyceae sp. CCMP2097]|mmetsp:Transcript_6245/g.22147  ORF Transcript_6245/g.22147 Transcript_6245/m.22147 type:complete len:739 (+) Transcript_6245:102-2318(+)